MGRFPPPLLLLVLAVSLARHKFVFGRQVNRTFDDALGDPTTGQFITYTPPLTSPSLWVDQTCQECTFLPSDPTKAFMGTFHGATYNPTLGNPISFQLNFTGTAVYVFFTLVNNANTFVNFTVDNKPAGFFTYNANTEVATQYQVLVFSHTKLHNSQHSLLASNTPSSVFSYVNFDYAVYTQDDGLPEISLSSSSGTVPTSSETPTSKPSLSLSASVTPISGAQRSSQTINLNGTMSRAPSISVQLSTTIATVIDTNTASGTLSSTPRPTGVAQETHPTRLAISGAVLGPIAVLAAAGLLLRYIHSRKQVKSKKRDPTPFTEVSAGAPSSTDHEIFVPPLASKRRSRDRISALLPEKVRDALRRTRQEEIEERLRTLRGEIVEISSKLSARGAMVPANGSQSTTAPQHAIEIGDESASSRRLRRKLYTKRRQIEHVENHRQSPWALGLSEESPLKVEDSLL